MSFLSKWPKHVGEINNNAELNVCKCICWFVHEYEFVLGHGVGNINTSDAWHIHSVQRDDATMT